jgi:hypothetical protein
MDVIRDGRNGELKMKNGEFRKWVADIWHENQEERLVWRDDAIDIQTYFEKYKWWLKREYRYRQSVQNT